MIFLILGLHDFIIVNAFKLQAICSNINY